MLEFTLGNEPLFLNADTSVRLTWRSPFFTFREFPGDTGIGIEIPVNDRNRAVLGNPERFEKQDQMYNREFPQFKIRYSGWQAMEGTLVIQNATAEHYSGWLRSTVGTLGKAYREKYIHETGVFQLLKTFTNKTFYEPGVDDYCCPPVWNPYFFEDVGKKVPDSEESILNHRFKNGPAGGYVNAKNGDGSVKAADSIANILTDYESLDVYAVTPMLFLNFVIKELLKANWLYIDQDYLSTTNFYKNLCIYNNYDITGMLYGQSELWLTLKWFDAEIQKATAKEFSTISRYYFNFFKYASLLPKITFKDFILSVQNISNTCFHFKRQNKVDILSRESILLGDAFDLSRFMTGNWELGEKKDVTLKFTFETDNNDSILSERWTSLDERREDIREAVETWSDLEHIASPEFGEIRYIKNTGIFAEYRWVEKTERDPETNGEVKTDMLGWEHISLGMQNGFYNYGKNEVEEIPTKFCTFATHYRRTGAVIATAFQRGNMGKMKYSSESFAPRIWSNAGELWGNFEWEGEEGLIARRWPVTARFLSSRQPVTGQAHLPVNVLDYVIRNIPNKFRAREGEFLIEELECEFSTTRMGVVKMKGYKV